MLVLRPDQTRGIDAIRAQYAAGKRAVLYVAPTGSGKTIVSAWTIRASLDRGRRVLFAAGRIELLDQTVAKLAFAGVTDVRLIGDGRDEGSPDAPVVVASIATLATPRWISSLPPADLVILDEAQHGPARTWAGVMRAYAGAHWLGLTATPMRRDGSPMGDLFDALVVGPTVRELTDLGHLVPCLVLASRAELGPGKIADDPIAMYRAHSGSGLAVVFCASVEHAKHTAEVFTKAGIPADHVSGAMASRRRASVLERWRAGGLRVVCNVDVLTEGFDLPELACAILLRRFGHVGSYLQAAGRILRPAPGKLGATLIDLCGSVLHPDFGPPDRERVYSLDGKAISTVMRDPIRQCRECGAVFVAGPTACPGCGAELPVQPLELPRNVGVGVVEIGSITPKRRSEFVRQLVSNRWSVCCECGGAIKPKEVILWATQAKKARHVTCRS